MKHTIEIEFEDCADFPIDAQARPWLQGDTEESELTLWGGGGSGSPYLIFCFLHKPTARKWKAVADIRPVARHLGLIFGHTADVASRSSVI